MSPYADLVDQLSDELEAMALGVIHNEYTHRNHPTYITKKAGREDFARMQGARNLYFRVFPLTQVGDNHPAHQVIKLIDEACRVSYWF
jgi:hypothetical protein